jgi:hypothetical protein
MLAYAGMAIDYNEMNKIIEALELTKDLAKDGDVMQYSGDKQLVETFKVLHKKFSKSYTQKGSQSNIGDKLEDYFQSVIYGKHKIDEGTFGSTNVDVAKTLDTFKDYTGAVGLGLNLFSGISNVLGGKIQMFIESFGEHFDYKNFATGEKNYWAHLPEYMAELNSINKTSKMALLIDEFDAMEDFYRRQRSTGYYKGPLSRIIGSSNIYFLNNIGEHSLRTGLLFTMLDAYRVKDSKGNDISIFDAFYVETKDDKGNTVPAYLKIKEGVTKTNGEPITKEDLFELKLQISKVSQAKFGAFNEDDMGAIKRRSYGRLIMQFRQWMPAFYGERFAGVHYDARLGKYREGYYRTFFRFSWELLKDIRRAKFEVATRYRQLDHRERANIRKALAEITTFYTLVGLVNRLGNYKDRKGKWKERMIAYALHRAKLEVGAAMPFNPEFLSNIWSILRSPAAALNQLDNMTNLIRFDNMCKEIEAGRYKGWSEWEADFVKTLPIYGQVRRAIDLKNESYMFNIFER